MVLDLEGWMDEETLRQALEGLASRNRDGQARQLLDLLSQEPDNAAAWIWLAREARAGVEKRACLQKALQLESDHTAARLDWARLVPLPAAPARSESWLEADKALSASEKHAAPNVRAEAEPDGESESTVELDDKGMLPEEPFYGVELPRDPLVQIAEGKGGWLDDDPPELESKASNARVFEPLLDIDLPMDLPEADTQPAHQTDWHTAMHQDSPATDFRVGAAARPGRRASTSKIVLIVVLALLLVTNIWTALSIVRLKRTVQTLETQTTDTHTLVTTFQEMVLDLMVRIDTMSSRGP